MKKLLSIAIILTLILYLSGCNQKNTSINDDLKISKNEFMLDTMITITIFGTEDDLAINELFKVISELENKLSIHKEGSELDLIRNNAGIKPIKVSEDTLSIFEKSIEYSIQSEGLFDITSAPLIDLWAIGSEEQHLPSQTEIKSAIELINYDKIIINNDNSTVFIDNKDMYANLGAIAKGYIADKVAEKARELNIESAILNLGGNVLLIGSKPDGSNFKVGIQDPDETRGGYMGIFEGSNLSIVTSGDYERYFIENGVKYHHILNPYTGYPAQNNIKSVSIITNTSFDGDALSTSVLLMGIEKGLELIENTENTEAIFITKDNKIILSKGIGANFELTSQHYSFK